MLGRVLTSMFLLEYNLLTIPYIIDGYKIWQFYYICILVL